MAVDNSGGIRRKGTGVYDRRNSKQQKNQEIYTPEQVKAVARALGITIITESYKVITCLCPFHHNRESGVFSINLTTGEYYCHNPACNRYGHNLVELVMWITRRNQFEAKRYVNKRANDNAPVSKHIEDIFKVKFEPFDQALLDRLYSDFPGSPGQEYMRGRGFTDETLDYFRVGWSAKQQMVITPLYSYNDVPLGFQARAIDTKKFMFSTGIEKHETLFNLNNAKRHSSTVIFVEAPFDAMRIHQAGYPNVVALAGGSPSVYHYQLLDRHFDKLIYFADNDNPADYTCKVLKRARPCSDNCPGHPPGVALGEKLASGLRLMMYWAKPIPNRKDACDMNDEQINESIQQAESHFERLLAKV